MRNESLPCGRARIACGRPGPPTFSSLTPALNPPTPSYVLALAYPSRHKTPTATLASATVPLETPILATQRRTGQLAQLFRPTQNYFRWMCLHPYHKPESVGMRRKLTERKIGPGRSHLSLSVFNEIDEALELTRDLLIGVRIPVIQFELAIDIGFVAAVLLIRRPDPSIAK